MTDISISTVALTIAFDILIKILSQTPEDMIQDDKNPVLFNLSSQTLAQCREHGRSPINVC